VNDVRLMILLGETLINQAFSAWFFYLLSYEIVKKYWLASVMSWKIRGFP